MADPTQDGIALAATLRGHQARISKPAWSPDGSKLASGSEDDFTVRIWSAKNWEILHTFSPREAPVGRIAWSPDGKYRAAGDSDGIVWVWKIDTGDVVRSLDQRSRLGVGNSPVIRCIDWSPDGDEDRDCLRRLYRPTVEPVGRCCSNFLRRAQ